jgi:hypothetical protein
MPWVNSDNVLRPEGPAHFSRISHRILAKRHLGTLPSTASINLGSGFGLSFAPQFRFLLLFTAYRRNCLCRVDKVIVAAERVI